MPRDLSGNYSRVNPPGATGYLFNTTIDQNQVNSEINDIGAELTDSISASGKKTATANLPMGGFVHSGLGMADADGETVRFQALKKGSDIAVTANGTVAIPAEGALFNLTAASAFNVTGFTGGYDGRTYSVRFNPDKLLTLVNSSTFKLLGGVTRITRAGEILRFTQESAGVIAEIGQQPVIEMTGYSGSDIALGINQVAKYVLSAVTTIDLRIAAGDGQRYEIEYDPNFIAAATIGRTTLQMNNANTGATAVTQFFDIFTTVAGSVAVGGQNFNLTDSGTPYSFAAKVCTNTLGKTVKSQYASAVVANASAGTLMNVWTDTTTVITKLGTVLFAGTATSGTLTVKRII